MKKYKHLIFDLDHTLWDFDRNSSSALEEIYEELSLKERGIPEFPAFLLNYKSINEKCWADYRVGKLEKEVLRTIRFRKALELYGIDDDVLVEDMSTLYLSKSPRKKHVIEGAHEALVYLKEKYSLHILTNGFVEIQEIKMTASKLNQYFTHVIASEHAGAKKPHPQAFNYTLEQISASIDECIMIGDNPEADIKGALDIGMDTVYFNRDGSYTTDVDATYQIKSLKELLSIF